MNSRQALHQMVSRLFLRLLFLFALLPCQVSAGEVESVLIISIDALHPDALGKRTAKNIHAMMERGVFTLNGHSTSPPLTLLSHAAMFSGIGPSQGGRKDNSWHHGQNQIRQKTIFDEAKLNGFSTGFFYSKEKLGFLCSDSIDQTRYDPDFSVENAVAFFKKPGGKKFCFLHISGLDRTGPVEGWLSEGYMEELSFIDESLIPLVKLVTSEKGYLLIITSDHAGHGKIHGSDHPDDAKLPFVMLSDTVDLKPYQAMNYYVTDLKPILKKVLAL